MDDTSTTFPALATDRTGETPTAQLVCVQGPAVGRAYNLDHGVTIVGRASDANIAIASDDVSRRHARIWFEGDKYFIEDLKSRNGTRVAGLAITRSELSVGARIEIGASIFEFQLRDQLALRVERIQRLEVMSELTAGLAHDFRNMLSVVVGNSDAIEHMVRARHASDGELNEAVDDLSNAVGATLALMRRLFEFVRRDDTADRSTAFALRPVVEEALGLLRRSLPSSIDVLVDVDERVQVHSSREEMHQILSNLCLNARDAMPDGGWLEIRAIRRLLSRNEALSMQLEGEGDFVELRVVDSGVGMDEATLARIFEPFFTTKPPGAGSGLGLASVYGLVRSRGGNVFAESTRGAGATFRIIMPAPRTDTSRRQAPTMPVTSG